MPDTMVATPLPAEASAKAGKPAKADINTLRAYAKAYNKREDLQSKVKALTAEIEAYDARIIGYFENNGITSTNVDGRIVGVRKEMWAKVKPDVPEAVLRQVFQAAGLGDLPKVKVDSRTLSAFVREEDRNERWPTAVVTIRPTAALEDVADALIEAGISHSYDGSGTISIEDNDAARYVAAAKAAGKPLPNSLAAVLDIRDLTDIVEVATTWKAYARKAPKRGSRKVVEQPE